MDDLFMRESDKKVLGAVSDEYTNKDHGYYDSYYYTYDYYDSFI